MQESRKHGNLHSNPYLHSSVKDTPQYLMPLKNIEGHEQSHKKQKEGLTPSFILHWKKLRPSQAK